MPREIEVKTVLNKSKKRDHWFLDDYTFNPYSSCSFNCLYCYIRGSKYGTNLEKSITIKKNAIELLDRQLHNRAKKEQYGFIVISSATDPYLSIEKKYEWTRKALEVVLKHRFPVHMLTKSDLIVRDFDLLKAIDETAILPDDLKSMERGVIVSFSFSSLQDEVARIFEPGATPPSKRLKAIERSLEHGFLTGISLMPLLPFISDTTEQLDLFFNTFQKIKVDYILPATLTLFGNGPSDNKTLIKNAIEKHYPELSDRYARYFDHSNYMPTYYLTAFKKKMAEMRETYQIENDIVRAAQKKTK